MVAIIWNFRWLWHPASTTFCLHPRFNSLSANLRSNKQFIHLLPHKRFVKLILFNISQGAVIMSMFACLLLCFMPLSAHWFSLLSFDAAVDPHFSLKPLKNKTAIGPPNILPVVVYWSHKVFLCDWLKTAVFVSHPTRSRGQEKVVSAPFNIINSSLWH